MADEAAVQETNASEAFSSPRILVLHGPNLNLLGQREPGIYGSSSFDALNQALLQHGQALGLSVHIQQSNHEGTLIDCIQAAIQVTDGLVINPGGYTHTSVALRDALAAYPHPAIEVHISNTSQREAFRHHSYISPVVTGTISGLGPQGYLLALSALQALVQKR